MLLCELSTKQHYSVKKKWLLKYYFDVSVSKPVKDSVKWHALRAFVYVLIQLDVVTREKKSDNCVLFYKRTKEKTP